MSNSYRPKASVSSWGRSTKLLATTIGWAVSLLLIDWFFGSPVWNGVFYSPPTDPGTNARGWNALIYASIFVVGLPAVLMTWHWRDLNTQDKIANDRRDTTLKEFQEVQRNAAGIFSKEVPDESSAQLQSAALRQLGDFLRGTYGDSFRRPAFEILMAGHHAAVLKSDVTQLVNAPSKDVRKKQSDDIFAEANGKFSNVDRTRVSIIQDTMAFWLNREFDLSNRSFDFLDFSNRVLIGLEIRSSSFYFTSFQSTTLWDCNLDKCRFYYNDFRSSHIKNTRTDSSKFRESFLQDSVHNNSGPEIFDQFYLASPLYGTVHELDGAWVERESQLCTRWETLAEEEQLSVVERFRLSGGSIGSARALNSKS